MLEAEREPLDDAGLSGGGKAYNLFVAANRTD
jgi:hypothetical protein